MKRKIYKIKEGALTQNWHAHKIVMGEVESAPDYYDGELESMSRKLSELTEIVARLIEVSDLSLEEFRHVVSGFQNYDIISEVEEDENL